MGKLHADRDADADADGRAGPADAALLARCLNQQAPNPDLRRDLNRDGVVDRRDSRIRQTLP